MNRSELNAEIKKTGGEALDLITQALRRGEDVDLYNFGSFKVVDRPARVGKNPRTGEAVQIPAKKVIKFKASKNILG